MKYYFLFSGFSLLLLLSCTPPVVFGEAQPAETKSSAQFELSYQGVYICDSDSSFIVITDRLIYKERILTVVTTMAEIDSLDEVYIAGDSLYGDPFDGAAEICYFDDNIVVADLRIRDTLFQIQDGQVLKCFKGHHILNYKLDGSEWAVKILTQVPGGDVTLLTTQLPDDLVALQEITSVIDISTRDHIQYKISPTKAELRKLLRAELIFEECDYFHRVPTPISPWSEVF